MGQAESKGTGRTTTSGARQPRKTTHGSLSQRSTPPIVNTSPQDLTGAPSSLSVNPSKSQTRSAIIPRTFPRTRQITNISPGSPFSTQRKPSMVSNSIGTTRRVRQQFAERSAKPAEMATSSTRPIPSTKSIPIPINMPRTRGRTLTREIKTRQSSRKAMRSNINKNDTVTSSDQETSPPAKRKPQDWTATPGSTLNSAQNNSELVAAATVGPTAAVDEEPLTAAVDLSVESRVLADQRDRLDQKMASVSDDDSADEGDASESDDDEQVKSDSDSTDTLDESDDELEDTSDMITKLADSKSATSIASTPELQTVNIPAAVGKDGLQLRRSRRRSVPVRRLQVNPSQRVYISL